jgi:ferric-dicitrate binding protein FerR (iron transport regulator)
MSANLTQAVADARQAEDQAAQFAQILAVVQAVNAATPAAPAHAACSCSHEKAGGRSAGTVAAWVAGGAACACVLTGLFLAIALVAVAVTVGGCVSYLLVREIRKGK